MNKASAYANANIALIKYWGKNDSPDNVPIVPSLSMTLDGIGTAVTVAATESKHCLYAHGKKIPLQPTSRLFIYLEEVRKRYPFTGHLLLASKSSVPVAAGLASSASFYGALAHALSDYLALNLDEKDKSKLARLGSGSAARSIYGGFVGLYGGCDLNHDDAIAFPIMPQKPLDLVMIMALVSTEKKPVSSRDAMNRAKFSSPFFANFVSTAQKDFSDGLQALHDGNFIALGKTMERSTLKMFATMWTAEPPVMYWHPRSLGLIKLITGLRDTYGPKAFFTMDAGPNVKIFCEPKNAQMVMEEIHQRNLCEKTLLFTRGSGSQTIDEHLL